MIILQSFIKYMRQIIRPYNTIAPDYSKAFDSYTFINNPLPRSFWCGPPPCFLHHWQLFGRYYNYNIRSENAYTTPIPFKNGAKQSNPLSPTLINIVMDELIVKLEEKKLDLNIGNSNFGVMAYAHDTVLLSPSIKSVQESLNIVQECLN